MVFQKNVDRLKGNRIVYQKGANWFSISHALAEYVVENRKFIRDNFKYTFCGDEMFLQTLVWNSKFKNLINQNNYCGSASICRYIDWKRGGPYTFHDEDYEELMNCGQLFARKFNWEEDKNNIKDL